MDARRSDPGEHPTAALLAAAGWLDLLDDVHGGLCHDLNSRAASFEGLLQILEMDESEASRTLSYLRPEAERLASLAETLGLLSGRVDAPPEAFELQDPVAAAVRLFGRATALRHLEVSVTQGLPAPSVRASRPRVLRVVLLLLAEAGRAPGIPGLRVETSGEGSRAEVLIHREGDPGPALGPEREPLQRLLALDGGALLEGPGMVGCSFPGLGAG
ncbi:MAG TPA: hypothetical protein VLH75_16680 [Longimicrobiales bacterium]|nr:hypothetical protein [Longimicrobiales bacterium]